MKVFAPPGLAEVACRQAGLTVLHEPQGADVFLLTTCALRELRPYVGLLGDLRTRFVVGSVSRETFLDQLHRKHPEHSERLSTQVFLSPTWAWGWTRGFERAWDPTNLVLEQWAPEGLAPDGRFIECSTALNIERERAWLVDSAPDWDSSWRIVKGLALDRTKYTSVAGVVPRRGVRWQAEVLYAALAGALVMMHDADASQMRPAFSLSRALVERWSDERRAEVALDQHEALRRPAWSRDLALATLRSHLDG